jgi:putative flippase GtrA
VLASLLRFAAGGVLSAAVTIGTTALLHEVFGVRESIAAGAGFAAALTVNYFFLRHVVFRSSHLPVGRQLMLFIGSTGVFRGSEYLAFLALNMWLRVPYWAALPSVLCASFLLKFMVYDRLVFARRPM